MGWREKVKKKEGEREVRAVKKRIKLCPYFASSEITGLPGWILKCAFFDLIKALDIVQICRLF